LDDREGLLGMGMIQHSPWVGRARSSHLHIERDGDCHTTGASVYFGKRTSETYIRFYDKAAQQGVEGHWVRCEVEFKRERATLMATAIAGGELGRSVRQVLAGTLNFVVPSKDKDRDRWPVCDWWASFLGEVEKLRLSAGEKVRSIERAKEWVSRQVAPTLAMLTVAEGGAVEWLMEVIALGVDRMKPHHRMLAAGYCGRASGGLTGGALLDVVTMPGAIVPGAAAG
jgi:phage replication initiation protein